MKTYQRLLDIWCFDVRVSPDGRYFQCIIADGEVVGADTILKEMIGWQLQDVLEFCEREDLDWKVTLN